jgi:hypothetical protein
MTPILSELNPLLASSHFDLDEGTAEGPDGLLTLALLDFDFEQDLY